MKTVTFTIFDQTWQAAEMIAAAMNETLKTGDRVTVEAVLRDAVGTGIADRCAVWGVDALPAVPAE